MKNLFFKINSVAIIWASEKEGKIGNDLLKNLKNFEWNKYWVNPNWGNFEGIKFYEKISSLPEVVDIAVIVIPARFVISSLEELADFWIKRVIIISAWFKEIWNIDDENKIKEIAKKNNVQILGPNCLGYIDTYKNLNLSFGSKDIKKWNIAMISQSWAMAVAFTDWALDDDLGFSKIISMWNKADIWENELLLELEKDEKTKVIVMYLESIEFGREFYNIAKRVTKNKPIILVKSWMSDKWSKAASSHTWALAWSAIIFRTAFKQAWIIYTQKLEDFFLWWKTFSNIFEESSTKNIPEELAIITNAWWPWVMITDHSEKLWLKLAEFDEKEKKILKQGLPESASVKNPIDIIWDATSIRYFQILQNLNSLEKKRGILIMLTPQTVTDTDEIARVIVNFKKQNPDSFVMTSFMWGASLEKSKKILKTKEILDFDYPQKAVLAYSQLLRYKRLLKTNFDNLCGNHCKLEENKIWKINSILKTQWKMCDSVWVEKIMDELELPFVKNYLVKSEKQAEEIFEKIKAENIIARISSEDIPHKTDVWWVIFDIKTKNDAVKAYNTIIENVEKNVENANIEGVMYSVYIWSNNNLRELFVWLKRDVTFGNILIVWMWWIYVNVYEDVSRRLSPIWKEEIIEMFKTLKWYPILAWYRWEKSIDFDKVSDIILKFIKLFESIDKIKEIDINPMFVTEEKNYLVDLKLYL